jgi:small-conductance mechanosensitive channel
MWHEFIRRLFGVSETIILGNSVVDWIGAGVLVAGVWSVLVLVRQIIASRYRRFTGEDHATAVRLFAYLIGHTKHVLFIAISLYAAEEFLTFPKRIHVISTNIIVILLLVQVGIWAGRTLQFYLEIRHRRSGGTDMELTSSLDIIKFVSMVLIWSLVTLVALDNLGVNITALLAGLGVGGVAVALALQNVLGDLFASLAIALDKPFVVGDTLEIESYVGKVERIGIKTTRLRSVAGEQIILSNADILKSRVRNYGAGEERRALQTLNIDPATPVEQLREIPRIVEDIVKRQPHSRFERCHLKTFGDWSLQFEMAYFSRDPVAMPVLDLQQAVSLGVLEELRRRGIALALPAQRVVDGPAAVQP